MSVEDLFARNKKENVIEGYLGDDDQAKILFLLREPNSGGKRADNFWFYDAIKNNIDFDQIDNPQKRRTAKIAQTKYINVLGTIARRLIQTDADEVELLKQCAYINLYPFSGYGRKSKEYNDTYKILSDIPKCTEIRGCYLVDDSPSVELVHNRLSIIKNIGCRYIVTMTDIFDALICDGIDKNGFTYKKRKFHKAHIFGKDIYEFYHPCAHINKDNIQLTYGVECNGQ